MDITEFLQQSAGKWFSHRTSHHLASKQSESGKSNIMIEMIPKDDPLVVKLCEQHQVDPAQALCGARVTRNDVEADKRKQADSTILVLVENPDDRHQGRLLSEISAVEKSPTGRYVMGDDDTLTLIAEDETMYAEERLWFASPNLRLRTSTLKGLGGFSMASFYTEIRMGGVQPPKSSVGATEANS
jgi:CpeS-like protein